MPLVGRCGHIGFWCVVTSVIAVFTHHKIYFDERHVVEQAKTLTFVYTVSAIVTNGNNRTTIRNFS